MYDEGIWRCHMSLTLLYHMTKMSLLSKLNMLCLVPRVKDDQLENKWRYFLLSAVNWKINLFLPYYSERPFSKSSYNIETSQLLCKQNQLTSFCMIWVFTERYFRIVCNINVDIDINLIFINVNFVVLTFVRITVRVQNLLLSHEFQTFVPKLTIISSTNGNLYRVIKNI